MGKDKKIGKKKNCGQRGKEEEEEEEERRRWFCGVRLSYMRQSLDKTLVDPLGVMGWFKHMNGLSRCYANN